MAALTFDIVVYGSGARGGDVVETTIRASDPDLSALTAGLVSSGAPDRVDETDQPVRDAAALTGARELRTDITAQ